MNDPTLIADLVRAGLDADLIGRVVNALMSAGVCGHSADASADRRRAADRERKRLTRISKHNSKANDVELSGKTSADMSADNAEKHCDVEVIKHSSSQGKKESSSLTESSKSVSLGRRGSRISADWQPDKSLRQWASGLSDTEFSTAIEEFRDYWIAVPGQRGTKLDWDATLRNRLRDKFAGRLNGPAPPSSGKAAWQIPPWEREGITQQAWKERELGKANGTGVRRSA